MLSLFQSNNHLNILLQVTVGASMVDTEAMVEVRQSILICRNFLDFLNNICLEKNKV